MRATTRARFLSTRLIATALGASAVGGCVGDDPPELGQAEQGIAVALTVTAPATIEPGQFLTFDAVLGVGDDTAYDAVLTFSMDDINGLNTPAVDDGLNSDAEADFGLGLKAFQPAQYYSALVAGPAASAPLGLNENATTGATTWTLGTIPDGWTGATAVTIRAPYGLVQGSTLAGRFRLTYATTPGGATTTVMADSSASPTVVPNAPVNGAGTLSYGSVAPGTNNRGIGVSFGYQSGRDTTGHTFSITSVGTCTPVFRGGTGLNNPWNGSAPGSITSQPAVGAPMTGAITGSLARSSRWSGGGSLSRASVGFTIDIPAECASGTYVQLQAAETVFTGTAAEASVSSGSIMYVQTVAATTCPTNWYPTWSKSNVGNRAIPNYFGPGWNDRVSLAGDDLAVFNRVTYNAPTVGVERVFRMYTVPAGTLMVGVTSSPRTLYKDCDGSGLLPDDAAFTLPLASGWSAVDTSSDGPTLVGPSDENDPGAAVGAECRVLATYDNVPGNTGLDGNLLYRACHAGEACAVSNGTTGTTSQRWFRTFDGATAECPLSPNGEYPVVRHADESYPNISQASLSLAGGVYQATVAAGSAATMNFSVYNYPAASSHIIGTYTVDLAAYRTVIDLDAVTGGFTDLGNLPPAGQNVAGVACDPNDLRFVPPSAVACSGPGDPDCLARWEVPEQCQPGLGQTSTRLLLNVPVKRGATPGTVIALQPSMHRTDLGSLGADNRVPVNVYGMGNVGGGVQLTVQAAAAVALTQGAPQQWPEGSSYLDNLRAINQGNVRLAGIYVASLLPRTGVLGSTATPGYGRAYVAMPAATGTGVVEWTSSPTCLTDAPGAAWTDLGALQATAQAGFDQESAAVVPAAATCARLRLASGSAGLDVDKTMKLAIRFDTTGLANGATLVSRSVVGVSTALGGTLTLPPVSAQDVTTTISSDAAAVVTKVAETDPTRAGFTKWTIHYANRSGRALANLELTDVLPDNVTFAGLAMPLGAGQACLTLAGVDCATEDVGGDIRVRFAIDALAPDDGLLGGGDDEGDLAIWTVAMAGLVADDDVTNCGAITGSTPPLVNDSTGCATTHPSALSVVKAVVGPDDVAVGAEATYAINATNLSASSAVVVKVTDGLPAFTAYVPGSLRIGGLAASDVYVSGGVFAYTHSSPLAPGATLSISLRVAITGQPPGGTITNVATAAACRDPDDLTTCGLALASDAAVVTVFPDADGDGVGDDDDDAPNDPTVCRDIDGDTCDDCSVSGADHSGGAPGNDGADNEFDGTCDVGDPDDDNDGVCDGGAAAAGSCIAGPDPTPTDGSTCGDRDADTCDDCSRGTVNANNDGNDNDNDGLCNNGEQLAGTEITDGDTDDDGVGDGQEPSWSSDTDGDGLVNARDVDSDDDGLFDGTEMGRLSPANGTDVGRGLFVVDADPATTTNPLDADTDNGGVRDGAEDPNHNGKREAGELDPNVGADDSTPLDDDDGDGLPNLEEEWIGTDPQDADSDDDGLADGDEPNFAVDADGDDVPNAGDGDSDNDGLFDGTEAGVTTPGPDTDVGAGNFIPDADPSTHTSPDLADTDGGGRSDGLEDFDGNGQVDLGEYDPLDGTDDATDLDLDGDGILDIDEGAQDLDGDGVRDYLDLDADGDGIYDADEAGDGLLATPPRDFDGDGTPDFQDLDSDGDDITDGEEAGDADPETGLIDTDTDGTADVYDADSDADGVPDIEEAGDRDLATDAADSDGDGTPDFREQDSDDDGLLDAVDNCRGTPNLDQIDVDNDDVGDACDLLIDADGDQIDDAVDLCPGLYDPAQGDGDADGNGDACDDDNDGDQVADALDNCPDDTNPEQADTDGDGRGDVCDTFQADRDDDGIPDAIDLCPLTPDPDQLDTDGDGLGDACDGDLNGDGVPDEYDVLGSSNCQAGSAGGSAPVALVLVALVGWRRRRRSRAILSAAGLGGVALAAGASPAAAQVILDEQRDFAVERFHAPSDRAGLLGSEGAALPPRGALALGVWFGASGDPLVLRNVTDDVEVGSLVDDRIGASLAASYVLLRRLQIGVELPLVLSQSGDASIPGFMQNLAELGSTGLGDLRIAPKLSLLGGTGGGIDLAVLVPVTLPTGGADDYRGDESLTVAPTIAIGGAFGGTARLLANAGYLARKQAQLVNLSIDDELFVSAGVGFRLAPNPIELQFGLAAATAVASPLTDDATTYGELQVGADVDLPGPWALAVLGGIGVRDGYGTPDWRATAGLRFAMGATPAAPVVTTDDDGDDDDFADQP